MTALASPAPTAPLTSAGDKPSFAASGWGTATTVSPSMPVKSGGLHVNNGRSLASPIAAIIAGIALANDLPLFTCNPQDFAGIDGLSVVAVPHPDAAP